MKYRNVIAVILGAWFAAAASTAGAGVFKNGADNFALPVAVAAFAPIALFILWFRMSARFRQYLYGLNPRTLTMVHGWRVNGVVFLILSASGLLPWFFALPAGLGDMAVGITAPWVASKFADREHKGVYIFWQLLGVLDLITAVALGTTARLIRESGAGMGPMTFLPLSLVPTFFVPLLLIIHVISIAQARRWPGGNYSRLGERSAPASI